MSKKPASNSTLPTSKLAPVPKRKVSQADRAYNDDIPYNPSSSSSSSDSSVSYVSEAASNNEPIWCEADENESASDHSASSYH